MRARCLWIRAIMGSWPRHKCSISGWPDLNLQIGMQLLQLLFFSAGKFHFMHHDREQLDIRDRRWFLRNFTNCFVGSVREGISASNFILHTFANGCRISKYEKKYFLGRGKCTHHWRADHETLTPATQEAVDLMLQLKLARTRWEAVLLGRQLVTVKWQFCIQYVGSISRLYCWNTAWTG